MTVRDFLRVGQDRWKSILSIMIIGMLVTVGYFLIRPEQYTAKISLYVSAQVGDDPQQAYQGAQLSEQRVKSYTELVTDDRVLSETIRRLNLQATPMQLSKKVTATSALDSVLISVDVTDSSPREAASIVNTVGAVTTEVVADLERPDAPNAVPPVAVRLVQLAPIPTQPSSTGLLALIFVGLLIGAVAGFVLALVRNSLDNTVKSVETLNQITHVPNLGSIPAATDNISPSIAMKDAPQGRSAEAYRQLRTNLQFVDVDRPRKVVLITSALPAEGKSTTVANLAIALSATDKHVLVIEADMRRPALSEILDVDRTVGLSQVLVGQLPLARAVQAWGGGQFDILPSGRTPPNPSELLGSKQMTALIERSRSEYDAVLIDSPPLLPVADAAAIAPAADGALLICRFKQTTRAQLETAVNVLRDIATTPLGTVLTWVPATRGTSAYESYGSYSRGNDRTRTAGSSAHSLSTEKDSIQRKGAPLQGVQQPETTARLQSRQRKWD